MIGTADLGRLWHHGRVWLNRTSRDTLTGCGDVADESDRWFLAAVRGFGSAAQRAEESAGFVRQALAAQLTRLRPRWMRDRTPRERIQRLLRREARRLDFDITQDQFLVFSENISMLLELVYTGAVRIDDVAFEHASAEVSAKGTGVEPSSSPDTAEEVSEDEQRDEGKKGHALRDEDLRLG